MSYLFKFCLERHFTRKPYICDICDTRVTFQCVCVCVCVCVVGEWRLVVSVWSWDMFLVSLKVPITTVDTGEGHV